MALTTYSELQASIANFLDRDDLTAIIPDFIALAEAQHNRDLRHWQMQNRATTTIEGQYATRPTDWIETVRFHLVGSNALTLVSRDYMAELRANDDSANTPKHFTHSEGQFEVYPTPGKSTAAEVLYMQKIPALSDSNASNWLLEYAPDAYLYGALIHAAIYLQDELNTSTWAQMYGAVIAKLNLESKKALSSGAKTARIRGIR